MKPQKCQQPKIHTNFHISEQFIKYSKTTENMTHNFWAIANVYKNSMIELVLSGWLNTRGKMAYLRHHIL